ncbi:MAG TPA: GNAT family N-acetyltransferase [Bryobacteraceae bacterium]|jgi:GNAT superfamily N-acetyltransferase|nr:GNAT family N-acetyltransferase [Bryobacteraceae bacterium]
MHFRLRVATAADIPAITALIADSVRGLQAKDYTARQIEGSLATVFTVDTQLIADGTYFIAVSEDGTLAGCGGWSYRKTLYGGDCQIEKAEPDLLDPVIDAAKVRAIFVAPRFARQGLGSLLLNEAETAAIAAGFRRFEMGSTLTGVALYALKGYREIERVQAPVGGNESIEVVRMEKRIVPPAAF